MYIILKIRRLFQYLAAFSGAFAFITSGINTSWSSPYLPLLLAPNSTIPTTNSEGLWCAIMPLIGSPLGALVAATLCDTIGRKHTTLLTCPIIFLSFVGMAFAPSITLLSVLRFTIGSTEGVLFTALPTYIGEISDPEVRGFLASMGATAYIVGTLFINVVGQMYTIFTSSLICAFVPVIHFLTFAWMPESPYFYIKMKKFEDARRSLAILKGKKDVDEELSELCQVVEQQEINKGKIIDLVTVRENRRACFIFVIVCVTTKFSGKIPTQFYSNIIFGEAGGNVDPEMSVIICCIVELITTLVVICVVDRCGRRPLFISSALGCSICLFTLGTYFYLKNLGIALLVDTWGWVPLTSLVAYNIFFNAGIGFAHYILISELFPTNVKAIGSSLADSFSVGVASIASKFFQISKDEFGMFVPFWTFGICCVVGSVLIAKFMPETKGKSLEEIQQSLNRKENESIS